MTLNCENEARKGEVYCIECVGEAGYYGEGAISEEDIKAAISDSTTERSHDGEVRILTGQIDIGEPGEDWSAVASFEVDGEGVAKLSHVNVRPMPNKPKKLSRAAAKADEIRGHIHRYLDGFKKLSDASLVVGPERPDDLMAAMGQGSYLPPIKIKSPENGDTIILDDTSEGEGMSDEMREFWQEYEPAHDTTKKQSNTIPEDLTVPGMKGLGDDEYFINEMFVSVQGEGINSGVPMLFVRFGGCNLRCSKKNAGFDCDTEFGSGRVMTRDEIIEAISEACDEQNSHLPGWVLFTGGEPGLQLDGELVQAFQHKYGMCTAVETNGTIRMPKGLDWVTVSPKSAWHTIVRQHIDELKLVRRAGQELPELGDGMPASKNAIVSPACQPDGSYRQKDLDWCVNLVLRNPGWRLSLQDHKILGAR